MFWGRFLFLAINILFFFLKKTPCIFIYFYFLKCFRFIILFCFKIKDFPAFLNIYCFCSIALLWKSGIRTFLILGLLGFRPLCSKIDIEFIFLLIFCKTKHHYVITCYTREFDGNLLDFYLYSLVK